MLTPLRALSLAFALALPATTTLADEFYGLDPVTSNLYEIDSATGAATPLGPITGGPMFGFANIAMGPDGTLYGCAPGAFSGYAIYTIDPGTLSATLLHSISGSSSGGVGLAVDPLGGSIWVAGFRSLSLIVELHEVNIASGARTNHGTLNGNFWAMAFDLTGTLYGAVQGVSEPDLIQIDRQNPQNSIVVGPMIGVDMTNGVAMSSALDSGAIHLLSRASLDLYKVRTGDGSVLHVRNLPSAGSIASFTEHVCTLITYYGFGCAGTNGLIPVIMVDGCPAPNTTLTFRGVNARPNAGGALFFGTNQTVVPLGGTCNIVIAPMLALNLPFSTDANGDASLGILLPGGLPSGAWITAQAAFLDPVSPINLTVSNGARVEFP